MTDKPTIQFVTMNCKLETVQIRTMKQADMLKCPHFIMMPDHYRDDGTCKCNDPGVAVMAEWGYVWDDMARAWISPPETEEDA